MHTADAYGLVTDQEPSTAPVLAAEPGVGGSTVSLASANRRKRRPKGATGTLINAGIISGVEPNPDLSSEAWLGTSGVPGIAAQMMRDPHVRQSIDYIANPLQAGAWRFKAASGSDLDKEVAKFCQRAFVDKLPWDALIRRIVRGYASNGFKLEEITYDNRRIPEDQFPLHPGRGIGIVPTAFLDRPAWTVSEWVQSKRDTSQIFAVKQQVSGSDAEPAGEREINADRLMRLTYDQEGANFEGVAILRSCYAPWKLKMAFQTIDAMKHERQGMGVPTIILGPEADDADIAAADLILAEMRANERGRVVLPNGYEFSWEGSGEGSDLAIAIERCNTDIAYNVSAGFMRLGLTGPGSFALGSTQQGQWHLTVEANGKFVADGFNTGSDGWSIVELIVSRNYGDGVAVPLLEVLNLPTKDWTKVAATVNACVKAGTITADDPLEDQLRDSMQLTPRDPETARTLSMFSWLRDKQAAEEAMAEDEANDDTTDDGDDNE